MHLSKVFFLISVSFFFLLSCDSNRIYEVNYEIPEGSWDKDVAKIYNIEIEDTSLFYNIIVNVRNKNDYPYSNLYLFMEMTSPSDKFISDTLEMKLANKTGKWNGTGIGNLWQNQIKLLSGVKMNEKGQYTVKINQGMRDENLIGISDVGLRIEKSE